MATTKLKPLWRCPECGARLVTANMWHSCGRFSLETLFSKSEPRVLPLFKRFSALVRRRGLGAMIPQKTRAVFVARTRFVSVRPRQREFLASFIVGRPLAHARIVKHEFYPPHVHLHSVRIASRADLDGTLLRWLRTSYRYYGMQDHMTTRPARKPTR